MINTITKPWFVIHKDGIIRMHGSSEEITIFPGVLSVTAEFDTETEMSQYIIDNNLQLPEEVENEDI